MAGILDELKEEVNRSPGTVSMLTAIEHSLEKTPYREHGVWWDRYLPLFMLFTTLKDTTKLERLTTALEEDLFTLFYTDLQEAFMSVTSQKSMKRLSSQDERYIKALIKKQKENNGR